MHKFCLLQNFGSCLLLFEFDLLSAALIHIPEHQLRIYCWNIENKKQKIYCDILTYIMTFHERNEIESNYAWQLDRTWYAKFFR